MLTMSSLASGSEPTFVSNWEHFPYLCWGTIRNVLKPSDGFKTGRMTLKWAGRL